MPELPLGATLAETTSSTADDTVEVTDEARLLAPDAISSVVAESWEDRDEEGTEIMGIWSFKAPTPA